MQKSMFETIMDLPLLKGMSRPQIESFVAETSLSFRKLQAGEVFIHPDDICESLIFILSGSVEITYRTPDHRMSLSQHYRSGSVLGAQRLFGMHHEYGYTARAIETVGLMEITKERYMKLLNNNHIFLLNILNLLSLGCQRSANTNAMPLRCTVRGIIANRLLLLTDYFSSNITIEAEMDVWKELTNLDATEIRLQFSELEDEGLIQPMTTGILIPNRKDFLDSTLS